LAVAGPELELVGVERMGGILASGGAVLARLHQKVVCNDDKVGNRHAGFGGVGVRVHLLRKVAEDQNGYRFDAPGRGARFGVVPELVLEVKIYGALAV
jgi:hypothetical protein